MAAYEYGVHLAAPLGGVEHVVIVAERALAGYPVALVLTVAVPLGVVGIGNVAVVVEGVVEAVPRVAVGYGVEVRVLQRHVGGIESAVGERAAPVLVYVYCYDVLRAVGLEQCLLLVGEQYVLVVVPSVGHGVYLRAVDVPLARCVVVSHGHVHRARYVAVEGE